MCHWFNQVIGLRLGTGHMFLLPAVIRVEPTEVYLVRNPTVCRLDTRHMMEYGISKSKSESPDGNVNSVKKLKSKDIQYPRTNDQR